MLTKFLLPISLVLTLFSHSTKSGAQDLQWYLLKSVNQLNEAEQKAVMSGMQELVPGLLLWYNGHKSMTFGCKIEAEVDWSSVLTQLNEHEIFLADVTLGELHHPIPDSRTSIFFQQAVYHATDANQQGDFTAVLIQDEWDALPVLVRNYYEEQGNYSIVNK